MFEALLRLVAGFFGTIIIFMILVSLLSVALGQSVPVHEAKPGEIDRSLNWPVQAVGLQPINNHDYSDPGDGAWTNTFLAQQRCEAVNNRLYAMVVMIARRIAENPERGAQWQGALISIHEEWCTSYD